MNKYYPDCPLGMRITDQESKNSGNFPVNTDKNKHSWTLKEKRILVMLKQKGKTFREIALAIGNGVSANQCNSAYNNMEERGELQIYEKIVLQGEEG